MARRRRSIRRRLIVPIAAMSVLLIALAAAFTIVAVSSYLQSVTDERLQTAATRVESTARAFDGAVVPLARIGTLIGATAGRSIVFVHDGTPLYRAGMSAAVARRLAARAAGETADRPFSLDATTRGIVADLDPGRFSVRMADGSVVRVDAVVGSIDTSDSADAVRRLVSAASLGALLAAALLIVFVASTVSRGLRPLRTMSDRAALLADGDRSIRLPTPGQDPSIDRLAETVNAAFDAQQDAEARVRAFVADASHELRTPLTVATGWVDLYAQGGLRDPDRLEHALTRVNAQLGRMRLLVDELGTLARFDQGRPLEMEDIDLEDIVRETVDDARVAYPGRTIALEASGRSPMLGDAPRLAQVFRNLVGNAVQHTPEDALIRVRLHAAASADDSHVVEVEDAGAGIAPGDLPHVFERFWRAEPSRARTSGGSGLGLPIAQSIAEAHGGRIAIASTPGAGTTLTVRLPPR